LGLGLDGKRIKIQTDGSDFPGIDFSGDVAFSYVGAVAYLKLLFWAGVWRKAARL
jgi:hypothetical protein